MDCFENQEGGDQECDDAAAPSTKESVWSQYINSSGAATSYTAETARIFEDPTSNCSTPRSSTVDVASSAGPPIKRFCATLKHVSDAAPVIYNFHRANYKSEEKQELDQKRRVHALPLLTRRANEPQVSTMVASFKSPTSSSRIARSSMRFLNFKVNKLGVVDLRYTLYREDRKSKHFNGDLVRGWSVPSFLLNLRLDSCLRR